MAAALSAMKLMPLKYELLGLAVLYVVWTIYGTVKL